MKREFMMLEVVCHRDNKEDEKLIFSDGEYKTAPIVNTVHMANEGMVAMIDKQTVDLLKKNNLSDIKVPTDVDSCSLILCKKTELTSSSCSVVRTDSREEFARVGEDLFVYENSKCDNVLQIKREQIDVALKLLSSVSRIVAMKHQYIEIKENNSTIDFETELNDALSSLSNSIRTNIGKVPNLVLKQLQ